MLLAQVDEVRVGDPSVQSAISTRTETVGRARFEINGLSDSLHSHRNLIRILFFCLEAGQG